MLRLAGQTVAGSVSAGAVVLVVTGLSLTVRRAAGWRSRRARQDSENSPLGSGVIGLHSRPTIERVRPDLRLH